MNKEEFIEKLNELNINITTLQLEKLKIYYNLLKEWNQKINLTNIIEENEVYLKHFYDSLTISKIIDLNKEESLCDIGTGAGFPGIVLKIIYPNLKVTLVDSLNKRIEFLKIVKEKLNLKDLEIIHARAEEFSKNNKEKYDIVTARAVSHLSNLLEYSVNLIKIGKYFIAMKANIKEELEESKNALKLLNCRIDNIIEFKLPFENSNRSLIKIIKEKQTNKQYPRKYSEIKKKRL